MTDESFLDDQYFLNDTIYNCPYCNRRHVTYTIYSAVPFDWNQNKECVAYFVRCNSCKKRSMHLTYEGISYMDHYNNIKFSRSSYMEFGGLDEVFFYSVPTSFFVLDRRIPRKLRDLISEAEGCLNGNFLTGASACARKIVYELASINSVIDGSYEEQIKSLKNMHSAIDGTYFDNLLAIQRMTSSKVHENSYDGWESRHVRLILSALREVLHEIYVAPAQLKDRRKKFLDLSNEILGHGASVPEDTEEGNGDKPED